jgi:hypothetical protein
MYYQAIVNGSEFKGIWANSRITFDIRRMIFHCAMALLSERYINYFSMCTKENEIHSVVNRFFQQIRMALKLGASENDQIKSGFRSYSMRRSNEANRTMEWTRGY